MRGGGRGHANDDIEDPKRVSTGSEIKRVCSVATKTHSDNSFSLSASNV